MTQRRAIGWLPDLLDIRDHLYAAQVQAIEKLPPKVDLRNKCPPLYYQDYLPRCTANAIAGAIDFERKKRMLPLIILSRLFIYYNERQMEGAVEIDHGAQS